jgi:biotin carboxyl carrier protein
MESSPHASPVAPSSGAAKPGMKRRWLLVVLVLTFLFILMPFLFWQATWFGKPFDDDQLEKALTDSQNPREVQHGLSQIADRILATDPAMRASAVRFYPEVVRIAGTGDDDLRLTAAWVMGQDNTVPEFGAELHVLLKDSNPMVRRNAALALIRFGDMSGRDEIRSIFDPYPVRAPQAGNLVARLKPGDAINPGTLLGHIDAGGKQIEIRSQVPGTIRQWLVANNSPVDADQPILLVDSSPDEIWEALRGLYVIGEPRDLPSLQQLADDQTKPDNVREQAKRTAAAIRLRTPGNANPATDKPAAHPQPNPQSKP